MTRHLPDLPGIITPDEVMASARWIADRQRFDGMIPWFDGGHCDSWNHVETAMALDIAGLHAEAELAYRWLLQMQLPNGAWHNYYIVGADGQTDIEKHKLDSNTIAYVATGVWHHTLITGDSDFGAEMFPMVQRAVDFVLDLQTPRGEIIWARHTDGKPWSYALLTGSSSICHALRCACSLASYLDDERPEWELAAVNLADVIAHHPDAFEPKHRWAMDWYYPVLSGALTHDQALDRLASRWDTFVMDGLGVRCVADEPWVTAAETAECAIAHAAVGQRGLAEDLLACTRRHRQADGAYLTGLVHPDQVSFPGGELTAYTAAAVILAADHLTGASPASRLFFGDHLPAVIDDQDRI
jgi:hypothetical protein